MEAKKKIASNCESCVFYDYDEDYDAYVCRENLDQDEMARFLAGESVHGGAPRPAVGVELRNGLKRPRIGDRDLAIKLEPLRGEVWVWGHEYDAAMGRVPVPDGEIGRSMRRDRLLED